MKSFQSHYKLRWPAGVLLVFLSLGTILWGPQQEAAGQSGVSVEANVDPSHVSIGDIVTFSVLVRHDAFLIPEMPDFKSLRGFKVLDSGFEKPESFAGQIESEFWVRLQAQSVGTLTIPSLPITLIVDGNDTDPFPATVMTPQVSVEVESVLRLQGEPTEIRDIKPLAKIERNWWPWFFSVLACIVIVIAAGRVWKKRRPRIPTAPDRKKVGLLPHELALRELDALRARKLQEAGKFREYYFGLSEIFRRYLEARYKFPALDWTTEEITGNLHRVSALNSAQKDRLTSILKNTDQVKFAKARVTPEDDEMQAIRQFIQGTVPEETLPSNNPNAER